MLHMCLSIIIIHCFTQLLIFGFSGLCKYRGINKNVTIVIYICFIINIYSFYMYKNIV